MVENRRRRCFKRSFCNTPVRDGMNINARSPRVPAARRENMRTDPRRTSQRVHYGERLASAQFQRTAAELNVGELDFDPVFDFEAWDEDFPSAA